MGNFVVGIIIVIGIVWLVRRKQYDGYGFPRMRRWTHSQIEDIFVRAFFMEEQGAMNALGDIWGEDIGSDEWHNFKVCLYEVLARKGDKRAYEPLGKYLVFSEYWKDGIDYLKKAAEDGSVSAMESLALQYGTSPQYGGKCYNADQEEFWLLRAVERGSLDAMYSLYFNYATREDGKRDRNKAMECLREAAELGHVKAKVTYAREYFCNQTSEGYDLRKGIRLLKSVMDSGDKEAICEAALELGLTYGSAYIFDSQKNEMKQEDAEDIKTALQYLHLSASIDPDGNAGKYYSDILHNTGFIVTRQMENEWIRKEEQLFQ